MMFFNIYQRFKKVLIELDESFFGILHYFDFIVKYLGTLDSRTILYLCLVSKLSGTFTSPFCSLYWNKGHIIYEILELVTIPTSLDIRVSLLLKAGFCISLHST